MAKRRDTGTVISWNAYSGDGTIRRGTNTYVKCSKKDLSCGSIEIGDTVTFVTKKAYVSGQLNATDIRKSYSHNNNQNKPTSSSQAHAPKHGILYFQKSWYTKSQMTHIANKFKNHPKRAPRVVFSDNYRDYQRKSYEQRLVTGPQAKVVAPYDRTFGFSIPTRFIGAKELGFINNDHNFQTLMREIFSQLEAHLRSGGDVIIPGPTRSDLKDRKWTDTYYKKGKQVIYHNIGTAMLKMKQLKLIQDRIDELKVVSSSWKAIEGEVKYHNYKLYTPQVTHVPQVQVSHAQPRPEPAVGNKRMNTNQTSHGRLVFQTSWFDRTQLERIAAEYKSDYSTAPRFLFGDNDTDKGRQSWKSRQMFGGQAGVVGKYDRNIGYGIVTTFFGASTPSLYRYKSQMDEQFKPLADHLRNGYDVIVPTPTSVDINKNRSRYYDYMTKKQVVFHNLGTGIASLSLDHIKYIQTKIDELRKIARRVDHASYYNYDPNTKQLKSRARSQYPAANAPKETYQQYNDPPAKPYAQASGATSAAHQQLIDQREWQCNLCNAISQPFLKTCNQCHAPKGAKKQVHIPNQNQVQRPVQPANQLATQHSGRVLGVPPVNVSEIQNLRNQIAQLTSTNMSLQQRLNTHVSDLQTANVQLEQQQEMQKKEKEKGNANNAEVVRLQQQVGMAQSQLNTKSTTIAILQSKLDDAVSENAQSKLDQKSMKAQESSKMDANNEQVIRLQHQVAVLQKSKEDQIRAAAIQIGILQTERDNAMDALRKMEQNNQLKSKEEHESVMRESQNENTEESSTKMDDLRDERDKALNEVQRKQSKCFELMEQIQQLMKQKNELQSKVHGLELESKDHELQEKVEQVEEQSEIKKLSEMVKRLQRKVKAKENIIQQLLNVSGLNKSTIESSQTNISQENADKMDVNVRRTHNDVQRKKKRTEYATNSNDNDANANDDDQNDNVAGNPTDTRDTDDDVDMDTAETATN